MIAAVAVPMSYVILPIGSKDAANSMLPVFKSLCRSRVVVIYVDATSFALTVLVVTDVSALTVIACSPPNLESVVPRFAPPLTIGVNV